MNQPSGMTGGVPPEQERLRARCFHPTGTFAKFKRHEIEQSIPQRLEQMASRYPERFAVKTRTRALSYEQLNHAANRLGHAILEKSGSGSEPVALLFEKDATVIAAFLGVLKAGKFYVPLDPTSPRARSAYILEDSQAKVLVTDSQNLGLARELGGGKLQIEVFDISDTSLPSQNLGLSIPSDNFAWIIYTSGSTGQAKGVVQSHRNALQYVMNYTNTFHICAEDRFSLLFSWGVNAAAHDILTALLNGATLLPFNLNEEGFSNLGGWLDQEKITSYCSVPTVLRHFATHLSENKQFSHVRLLRLVGEPVYRRDVEIYRRHFSDRCIFVNRLGMTETGSLLFYLVDKNTPIDGHEVPVGYPVEGNDVFLLDGENRRPAIGQIGEIAVNSPYLFRGYWRKPELTAASLGSDAADPERKIYRTGDLGRMLSDGCVVCLGRKDFQVKIRGHRIELSEIEMALIELDVVEDAVVTARLDTQGNQRLVGYVMPAQRPTVTHLRRELEQRLPASLIPSVFVMLDALPQLPNGKIDRRALPAPSGERPELDTPLVAPRTPVELTLARIWAEVLGLNQVGIHDNFFELGGHSLLAMQFLSRLRNIPGIELPVRAVFERPTVAELARSIDAIDQGIEKVTAFPSTASSDREEFEL